ncbi:MAG: Crp/Fnr family transcriptional regulator [Bacteroidetes bacterium]|nr:Crp/Fnr family transcriptional regulator [Bacteroidota bacterium]
MVENDPEILPVSTCATQVYDSPCFSPLTEDEVEFMNANSVTITFKKGETICKQGSFASNIMYLETGLVKVFLEGNPKNLILTITPSGHIIGLPSIFEGNNTYLYSVVTYVESVVKIIDINIFKQLMLQNASFAFRMLTIMNENMAQTYARFFCLTQKHLHGRLSDILICLSGRIFKSLKFDLPLSRNDLGELTGMSTESVIRLMKELKDDGLIEITGKSIHLLDVPRLMRISEVG